MKKSKKINRCTKDELKDVLLMVDPVLRFLNCISWHTGFLEGDLYLNGLYRWLGSADLYGYMVRKVSEELELNGTYRGREAVNWQRFAMYIENAPDGQAGKNQFPSGLEEIDEAITAAKSAVYDVEKKAWIPRKRKKILGVIKSTRKTATTD